MARSIPRRARVSSTVPGWKVTSTPCELDHRAGAQPRQQLRPRRRQDQRRTHQHGRDQVEVGGLQPEEVGLERQRHRQPVDDRAQRGSPARPRARSAAAPASRRRSRPRARPRSCRSRGSRRRSRWPARTARRPGPPARCSAPCRGRSPRRTRMPCASAMRGLTPVARIASPTSLREEPHQQGRAQPPPPPAAPAAAATGTGSPSASNGVSTVVSPSSATFGRPMIRRLIE